MQYGYLFLLSSTNNAMTRRITFLCVIVLLVGNSKTVLSTLQVSIFAKLQPIRDEISHTHNRDTMRFKSETSFLQIKALFN